MTLGPDQVSAKLDGYSKMTRAAMGPFLGNGEPKEFLYQLVRDYPDRGGKGIRPALLLATCQAFGGSINDGLLSAAALEMLHNAFLIHDDIEDQSPLRRGRATLHELHGLGLALNAGDALASLAMQTLRADKDLGSRLSSLVLDEFATMIRQTTEGQAIELGWRRRGLLDVGPADYFEVAAKKSCWYTTVAPLRIGAIIGSGGTVSLEGLSRYGLFLGLAFQIRDDLLDLELDSPHGKKSLGDLREGKRTLMLAHLLANSAGDERAWLHKYLGAGERRLTAAVCHRVLGLMAAAGSLEFARRCGDDFVGAARAGFEEAFIEVNESEHLAFLRGLIDFVMERQS